MEHYCTPNALNSASVAPTPAGAYLTAPHLPNPCRMITGELKSKIDRIWDTMWSGGVSNPLSVIEQLTYLLFIKRLDELHTLREHKAARLGTPIEEPIFAPDQDPLRWSRFRETAPETMFVLVRDQVFPFIKTLGGNGGSDEQGGS